MTECVLFFTFFIYFLQKNIKMVQPQLFQVSTKIPYLVLLQSKRPMQFISTAASYYTVFLPRTQLFSRGVVDFFTMIKIYSLHREKLGHHDCKPHPSCDYSGSTTSSQVIAFPLFCNFPTHNHVYHLETIFVESDSKFRQLLLIFCLPSSFE